MCLALVLSKSSLIGHIIARIIPLTVADSQLDV